MNIEMKTPIHEAAWKQRGLAVWPHDKECGSCTSGAPSPWQSSRFPLLGFGSSGSGFHTPLPRRTSDSFLLLPADIGSVVALFRPSTQLLLSAFKFVASGVLPLPLDWGFARDKARLLRVFNTSLSAYLRMPGVGGCQAKMLLGHPCFAEVNVTPSELDRALKIVDSMAFVGLTGDWDRTICLWHSRFGGPVRAVERYNTRPTPQGRLKTMKFKQHEDALDDAVYARAAARFTADVGAHRELVDECYMKVSATRNAL